MHDFQGYFSRTSRTLSFNFQDFPKWFSRTFQVLEFSRKKIQYFPGGVDTRLDKLAIRGERKTETLFGFTLKNQTVQNIQFRSVGFP